MLSKKTIYRIKYSVCVCMRVYMYVCVCVYACGRVYMCIYLVMVNRKIQGAWIVFTVRIPLQEDGTHTFGEGTKLQTARL